MIPVILGAVGLLVAAAVKDKYGDKIKDYSEKFQDLIDPTGENKEKIEERRYQRRKFIRSAQGQDLIRRAWEEYNYQLNNGNKEIDQNLTQSDMEEMYIRHGKISFKW